MSRIAIVSCVMLGVVGAARADVFSTNFDLYPLGVHGVGGADPRTPGADVWWNPDNSSTQASIQAGVGRLGSNGLVVGNRGNGFDGVINNLTSPRLVDTAGETTAPVNATYDAFNWSMWFRTVPSTSPSGTFSARIESWGTDRTTYLGFQDDGSGNLFARAYGMDATAPDEDSSFTEVVIAPSLNWGSWYRIVSSVNFVPGGAGVSNDSVTYSIYDESNMLVGSGITTTWEHGQRQYGYNGGVPVAVDSLGFHSRGGYAGDHFIVDDLTYTSIPTPGASALIVLGAALTQRRRRA